MEPLRRISTQSQHSSIASFQNPHHQSHQNSHGNYVDIDAIDSILSADSDSYHHYGVTPQYDRSSENRMQSVMDIAISSPIYENQSSLGGRSDSPIYSNTHNQSVTSLYSKAQNIYSNLPAITAGPSNAAYANMQPPSIQHHAMQPSKSFVWIQRLGNNFRFHFSSSATDRRAATSTGMVSRLHIAKSEKILHRPQYSNYSLVASVGESREPARRLLLQVSGVESLFCWHMTC